MMVSPERLPRSAGFVTVSFLAGVSVLPAQPATGTIEGRVLTAGNGEYLENARITVEGTGVETASNGRPLTILPATDTLGVSQLTYLNRGAHTEKEYLRLFPNLRNIGDATEDQEIAVDATASAGPLVVLNRVRGGGVNHLSQGQTAPGFSLFQKRPPSG